MLILRPIGDFFGMMLRPLVMGLLGWALPMYKEWIEWSRETGYELGEILLGILKGDSEEVALDKTNELKDKQEDGLFKSILEAITFIPNLKSDIIDFFSSMGVPEAWADPNQPDQFSKDRDMTPFLDAYAEGDPVYDMIMSNRETGQTMRQGLNQQAIDYYKDTGAWEMTSDAPYVIGTETKQGTLSKEGAEDIDMEKISDEAIAFYEEQGWVFTEGNLALKAIDDYNKTIMEDNSSWMAAVEGTTDWAGKSIIETPMWVEAADAITEAFKAALDKLQSMASRVGGGFSSGGRRGAGGQPQWAKVGGEDDDDSPYWVNDDGSLKTGNVNDSITPKDDTDSNAVGGMINEPIFGRGLRSGRKYTFGESGQEQVIPASRMLGGTSGNTNNVTVNVSVSVGNVASSVDVNQMSNTIGEQVKKKIMDELMDMQRNVGSI